MATVIGNPGRYAIERSIQVLQRMLLTTMLFLIGIGVIEGLVLASLFSRFLLSPWVVIAAQIVLAVLAWRLCAAQSQRIDRYERERLNWKSGAEGECVVASVLDGLPKGFVVFHDFNTAQGNFDHVVVGPTGIFALETKNFRGTIAAGADGELVRDGVPASQPYVKQFVRRIMAVREKLTGLAGYEVFIQGVMVFPKARVQAKFGSTQSVRCLREGRLYDYLTDTKWGRKLTPEQVDVFRRAFTEIARTDRDFSGTALAGVQRKGATNATVGLPSCSPVS
ncbi:MAG: nuclease-related domain-containing protein [Bryobacteraceae bacterium]